MQVRYALHCIQDGALHNGVFREDQERMNLRYAVALHESKLCDARARLQRPARLSEPCSCQICCATGRRAWCRISQLFHFAARKYYAAAVKSAGPLDLFHAAIVSVDIPTRDA